MSYALIGLGVTLVVFALLGRRRAPAAVITAAVGLGAGMVATGGLLLLGDATPADWVVALVVAISASILHARLVLGPFGKPA